MRLKRPPRASLDEVRISRHGDDAVIEYVEPGFWTTHLKLGPEVQRMTDEEILDRAQRGDRGDERLREQYEHVAVEIPLGRPQIERSGWSGQWTPRGDVLRCEIVDGGPGGEPIIHIDEHELSWEEFGRLLTTYAGWGMRVVFVPEGDTHLEPRVEVREPGRNEQ